MNTEVQSRLAEARAMLAEAKRLNDSGQHGTALKKAFHASEYVAATYLSAAIGQSLPPNAATFELFSETIHKPERHPTFLPRIEDVVGDVYVLREAYEPALLDKTTANDAQQMIGYVARMVELVESVADHQQ